MTDAIATSAWKIAPYAMTAQELYAILDRHKLLPVSGDTVQLIAGFMDCSVFSEITSEDGHVAFVVLSNPVPGERIDFDLIPDPTLFARGQYEGPLRECLADTLTGLFARYRRINAGVPRARARTKHALIALGFQKEGLVRRSAHFVGRDPEDVLLLGMLKSDYVRGGA